MPIWNNFPYSNTHELNLDYIIETQAKQEEAFENVIEEATELKNETSELHDQTQTLKDQTSELHDQTQTLKDQTSELHEQTEEIKVSLNSSLDQISLNTENIQINSGRIDEMTTLAEGSTTGDAELADIRVGANGVTYDNAGNAVRGQYQDLDSKLKKLSDMTIYDMTDNLFWLYPYTNTINGVTFSYNPKTGILDIDGTSTANALFVIRGSNKLEAGTYYAVLEPISNYSDVGSGFSVRYGNPLTGIGTRLLNIGNRTASINLSGDDIFVCITSGTICDHAKYKIQINRSANQTFRPGNFTNIDKKSEEYLKVSSYANTNNLKYLFIDDINDYMIDGKAYNESGKLVANVNAKTTDILRLVDSHVYIDDLVLGFATFDKDMKFIERIMANGAIDYEFDNDVEYIAVMFANYRNPLFISNVLYEKETTLKVDSESGFVTALNRCTNFVAKDKCIINIEAGVYDVYEELGGDTFLENISETAGWSSVQPVLTTPTVINGIGDVTLKMEISSEMFDTYQHQAQRLSVINCKSSIEVNNIKFITAYNRYAIHDECDNSVLYENTKHIIKDCIFNASHSMAVIGIGASTSKYEIINSYIFSDYNNGIFLHNWSNNKGGLLNIINTVISTELHGLRLSNNSDQDYVFNVNIDNTFINGDVYLDVTGDITKNLFKVIAKNTNKESLNKNSAIVTDEQTPVFMNW